MRVGLETERLPHPPDCGLDNRVSGHLRPRPNACIVRRGLQRRHHHVPTCSAVTVAGRPGRGSSGQPVQPRLRSTRPPLAHRGTAHPEPRGDHRVRVRARAPNTIRERNAKACSDDFTPPSPADVLLTPSSRAPTQPSTSSSRHTLYYDIDNELPGAGHQRSATQRAPVIRPGVGRSRSSRSGGKV